MAKGDGPPKFDCSALGASDREYCLIDRFEACAVKYTCPFESAPCDLKYQSRLVSFANCLEAKHGCSGVDVAAPCAKQAGLDATKITTCAEGAEAADAMNHIYGVGNSSDPVVTGFPDIRINNKTTPHAFPSFVEELERAICGGYAGPHPRACGPYLDH